MEMSNTPKIRQSDDPVACTKYHDVKGKECNCTTVMYKTESSALLDFS